MYFILFYEIAASLRAGQGQRAAFFPKTAFMFQDINCCSQKNPFDFSLQTESSFPSPRNSSRPCSFRENTKGLPVCVQGASSRGALGVCGQLSRILCIRSLVALLKRVWPGPSGLSPWGHVQESQLWGGFGPDIISESPRVC